MKLIPALAAALLLAQGAPAWAVAPIWRAVGADGKSTVTLFGSVHLLGSAVPWRGVGLDDALAHADEVWFEIPFDAASQAAASAVVASRGFLPAGRSLDALLTPAARTELAKAEKDEGLAPAALDRMEPWLAETLLSVTYLKLRGADPNLGVEETVSRTLPATIARKAFETPAQQIGFFADAPEKDQVASLNETLRELEEEPDSFEKLEKAWSGGDAAAIYREAVVPLKRDAPAAYQQLVVARNLSWIGRIQGMLTSGRRIVVIVGVGHLVGPDGVPALLRARGIKVEGP